jgi:hypothetical protein
MPTGRTPGPVGLRSGEAAFPRARSSDTTLPRQIAPGGAGEDPHPVGWDLFMAGGGKKASQSTKTKVINIATTFDNPWKGKIKEEIAAIANNRWAPSSDDFRSLVSSPIDVNHFHQLIGVILQQPKNSIERINILTHSNPDLIAFKGDITPRSTFAEVSLEISSALSLQMLEQITDGTWFQVGKSKTKHTMKDVRSRFRKGAKVFFYSCKSATDPQLLQEFADKFQVIAVGFKKNIAFCPKFTSNSIDRRRVGLGDCTNASSSLTAIDKHGVERKP